MVLFPLGSLVLTESSQPIYVNISHPYCWQKSPLGFYLFPSNNMKTAPVSSFFTFTSLVNSLGGLSPHLHYFCTVVR